MEHQNIQRIVFSGGGIRGIAFLGTLLAMKDLWDIEPCNFQSLQELVGCSIGALVALILCIKFKVSEMQAFLNSIDLSELATVNVESVVTTFGMNDGHTLWALTHQALQLKKIPVNITFAELYKLTNIKLHIFVTDLGKATSRQLSVDTDPHMSVAQAVVASMSLPPMFSPIKYNTSLLCDGGLMNNFPISNFPSEGTLGIRLAWYVDPNPPDTLLGYYTRVLACIQVSQKRMESLECERHGSQIILLDVGPMNTLHFDASKSILEQILSIVLQGYRQTIKRISNSKTIFQNNDPVLYLQNG